MKAGQQAPAHIEHIPNKSHLLILGMEQRLQLQTREEKLVRHWNGQKEKDVSLMIS